MSNTETGIPATRREKLIDEMAQAAHDAHYCGTWHFDQELCDHCKEGGECFELSGDTELSPEWFTSAEACMNVIENVLGVEIK